MPEQSSSSRKALIDCLAPFLNEIKNRTPGIETEQWLNAEFGVNSQLYRDLSLLIVSGVREGWAADVEINGPRYRRSQIAIPSEETFFFGITAVLMDSTGNDEGTLRGNYHTHPYGEINMMVPLTEGAALAGSNGWCDGGWTAPEPGSGHFPEVKNGGVISLTILPAGRIAFDVKPVRI